jgi:hypothetical protein
MATLPAIFVELKAKDGQFTSTMNNARAEITKLAKHGEVSMKKFSTVAVASMAVAGAAAGAFAVKIGIDSIKAASDLNEEMSKSSVIFGNSAKAINDYAVSAATSLGLSQKQALEATSTFATLGKAAGLTGKDLTKFSTGASTLAADLGSFYNTSSDEAITAIGAALRGESEPIRKFGVLLNDASLKSKAMSMGLYSGKGNLDLQAKSLAAYQIILDQTKDAQGDFSRTSGGMAGQTKILTAEMDNFKTQLGQKLVPIVIDAMHKAQGLIDGFTGIKNSAGDAGQAGYDMGKKIKDVVEYIKDNKNTFEIFGKSIAAAFLFGKAASAASAMVSALGLIRTAFAATTIVAATTAEAEAAATGGASLLAATPAIIALAAFFGTAMWSMVNGPSAAAVESNKLRGGFRGGGTGPGNIIAPAVPTYSPHSPSRTLPKVTPHGASNIRSIIGPTSGSGMNVQIHVAGSVIHERDLAVTVRDSIAQMMRRTGNNPAILGV